MTDWRTEARGLPVWAGAHFRSGDAEYMDICTSVEAGTVRSNGDEVYALASRCTPALDHPDTCAAFVRRLALRLGAPDGVVAFDITESAWKLYSCLDYRGRYQDERAVAPGVPESEPLLALVRAWRSVPDQPEKK